MTFEQLHLSAPLLRAVAEAGYTTPSPIQAGAIPPVAAGRDLMGCAQTGTGKTAAFALPMLQRLSRTAPRQKGAIRALILTPTRELALQIGESFAAYGKYLPLTHTVIFGGVGQAPQVEALKKGVDILIACPGRLNDLIGQGHVQLDRLEIFVLDEADRMLDMGFVHDVKKVIARLPRERQNLMFSATMPAEIEQLAKSILRDPAFVKVDPPSSTVERIRQTIYFVEKGNKKHLLPYLINTLTPPVENALVFSRTKHGADRIARDLCRQGIPAAAIHGNKSQSARVAALEGFKAGKTRVLVATDIAARGIDINELAYVFNYDLPEVPETYVHRIGRTARAGADGTAVSFCAPEEQEYLAGIEKLNRRRIPVVEQHPWAGAAAQPPVPPCAPNANARPDTAGKNDTIRPDRRKEETTMQEKEKRPAAEGQGTPSEGTKRRRRRRGAGQGSGAASAAAAAPKAENAPAKPTPPQGKRQNPPKGAPRQGQHAPAQQPKFDPHFLTPSAAQAVRGNSAPAQKPDKPRQNPSARPQPAKQAAPAREKQAAPAREKQAAPQKESRNAKAPANQKPSRSPEQPPKQQQGRRANEQPKAQNNPKPRQNAAKPEPRGQNARRARNDDPGLILISRRPPQQKFASFEEYMEAHGGVTAPVEEYSNE